MENTDHTFLVGKGAERQAKIAGKILVHTLIILKIVNEFVLRQFEHI
jgi:hypothetical protein